jgi:hypothetical protein
MPIEATHDVVPAFALPLAVLVLPLLLLVLLPQPAAASAPTAAAAMTRRLFTGYASISRYLTCRNRLARIARDLVTRCQSGWLGLTHRRCVRARSVRPSGPPNS